MPPKNEDTLTHYLVRNPKNNQSKAFDNEVKESKKASLTYKIIKKLDRFVILEIDLHTGRHHQIRAQLCKINCPIKGDLKYGAKRSNPNGGISLLARHVEFIHPVSKKLISVDAPLPKDNLWRDIAP